MPQRPVTSHVTGFGSLRSFIELHHHPKGHIFSLVLFLSVNTNVDARYLLLVAPCTGIFVP
jgi:hypothetical protein